METTAPDEFNAFEAAGWRAHAAGYDDFFGKITPRLVEPLLDAAGVGPSARVLDVASGPGYVTAGAAQRGASVVGVDVAETMLAMARESYPQLDFRLGDAEALAFPDGSFDAVTGNFLLHHLGRPERAAGEFARVLAPGGRLALTVWDLPERARFIGVLLDAVTESGAKPPADVPVGPPFFRFSEDGEMHRLLGDHGFEAIAMDDVSFELEIASPDALWHGLLAGTVRSSALVLGQPEPVQRRIRSAFDRLVAPYRAGSGLRMPVSVRVGRARKER